MFLLTNTDGDHFVLYEVNLAFSGIKWDKEGLDLPSEADVSLEIASSEEDMYEDVIKNYSFRGILEEMGGRKLKTLFGAQPVSAEHCFIDLIGSLTN